MVWIIVMFLSAVWTHSGGTHSLQRIQCWAICIMLHFCKSVWWRNKLNLNGQGWVIYSTFLMVNYSFNWYIYKTKVWEYLLVDARWITDSLILGGTTSLSNVLGSIVGASMSSSGIPGSTTLGNWLAGAGATDPIMPELDCTSAGPIKTVAWKTCPHAENLTKECPWRSDW